MLGFELRMDWLRYAVIWLIHPNILHQIARMFRALLFLTDSNKAEMAAAAAPPEDAPPLGARRSPRGPRQELSPCSSVPILTEFSLEGGRNASGLNVNSSCKNLHRDGEPNRCGARDNWCVRLPQIFIPARMESIRLKTMGALNVDPSVV